MTRETLAIVLVVGTTVWILIAFVTAAVARGKGLSTAGYLLLGLLLGLLGLAIALIARPAVDDGD